MWQKKISRLLAFVGLMAVIHGFVYVHHTPPQKKFPYQEMGFTKEQAATYLLNRFTFGPRPGEVDAVAKEGIEHWFYRQLAGNQLDTAVDNQLQHLYIDASSLSLEEMVNTYPTNGEVVALARKMGVIEKGDTSISKPAYREKLKAFMQQQGFKPIAELEKQLIVQKIIRAAYSNNQLQEVLTDFWFNHFNVSLTKPNCAPYVLAYERDAIRPHILDNFDALLLATAQHPAMLTYLDNAGSVSNNNSIEAKRLERWAQTPNNNDKPFKKRASEGLNENYAREVMELHTMGVDGGYTQQDVTTLAKILTGWAIYPMFKNGPAYQQLEKTTPEQLEKRGFVIQNGFFFRPNKHDDSPKTFLGQYFPANGGYKEGITALEMLAHQPTTAKFISTALAKHFVSDTPSSALIQQMTQTFLKTNGSIKSVLITMVNSPEFWNPNNQIAKIKSPFELAISTIRATNAQVNMPYQIFYWCNKMGQKFYYYQAPTGFPDRADYWINTGSLLSRMNFGLAFASQKIPGITLNLPALNNNHEPESVDAALKIYSAILLPARDNTQNIQRIAALIHDADLNQKLAQAANQHNNNNYNNYISIPEMDTTVPTHTVQPLQTNNPPPSLSQVVGVIIGSPEFQRK
ncbi:MAG: DUF1800 family protein [Sphingobacteriales bacterium]|uniref:DUF1800 domain-containing protein n=1 Tax=Hydrotalea flava TaxID=714549 RepID=UPI00082C9FD8|nr:DUF1800 domain-containing protein [Hydrotalea flava]RTL50553.1 MAG: DUF1800 family protein [Sphingobacteriales bacterium]